MMNLTVKVNNQTFQVEIKDINSRPVQAIVDGEVFEVHLENETPTTAKSAQTPAASPTAAAAAPSAGANTVNAPIPGVITTVKVNVGDTVAVGDELCILEAMKMNNAIRTTKAGTIKAVLITQGDHVQHGQALFELAA